MYKRKDALAMENQNNIEGQYLKSLLQNLFKDKNYSICIQDTSGVLHSIPWLNINYIYRVHTGSLCTMAKQTTRGLNHCSRMKAFSLNNFKPNDRAIISRCHYGIYEVAMPVFHKNILACAIYIGSFILKGTKQDVLSRAKKYSRKFDINYDDMLSSIDKMPEIEKEELEDLKKLAHTIAFFIQLIIEKSSISFIETSKRSRLNKSSSEGIHWAVAFAMEYVDMHYSRDIQLHRIARMLFLNPDYLSRLFHKETGKNFIDYLNQRRISEVIRIMDQSKANITAICYDVGFKNKPHFNRMFKRFSGMTPMEYKKLHKKNTDGVKHNPSSI